jgi:uncharacterized protein YbjT (DUF2867 family)
MVTPKWVRTKSQPIAISDVLNYLVKVINAPSPIPGIFEIGGKDIISYAEMMDIYAEEAGLKKRRLIPVPFLTPRLSSHWVGIVTSVASEKPSSWRLEERQVNRFQLHSATLIFAPLRHTSPTRNGPVAQNFMMSESCAPK